MGEPGWGDGALWERVLVLARPFALEANQRYSKPLGARPRARATLACPDFIAAVARFLLLAEMG